MSLVRQLECHYHHWQIYPGQNILPCASCNPYNQLGAPVPILDCSTFHIQAKGICLNVHFLTGLRIVNVLVNTQFGHKTSVQYWQELKDSDNY